MMCAHTYINAIYLCDKFIDLRRSQVTFKLHLVVTVAKTTPLLFLLSLFLLHFVILILSSSPADTTQCMVISLSNSLTRIHGHDRFPLSLFSTTMSFNGRQSQGHYDKVAFSSSSNPFHLLNFSI